MLDQFLMKKSCKRRGQNGEKFNLWFFFLIYPLYVYFIRAGAILPWLISIHNATAIDSLI